MFSKPEHGWTKVSFGEVELGYASYLTDVPIDTMDSFINYLAQNYFNQGFNLTFDAEGYTFSVIEFDGSLFLMDSKTDDVIPNIKELKNEYLKLPNYESLTNIIIYLAREIIDDITNYLQDWIDWIDFDDMTDEERIIRKENLLSRIEIIKRLIRKHEKLSRISDV